MILTYKECIRKYGSDYMIKKEIKAGRLIQNEKGIYSDSKLSSELELISVKYPRAIFAAASAYYYHGLTDVIPDVYYLSTKREDTRIKEVSIKQKFVDDRLFELGKTCIQYRGATINIYDKERLLVDLIRFKSKLPFDYYKEIITNYRRIIYDLDFLKVEDYASNFKNGSKIMDAIQLEVM